LANSIWANPIIVVVRPSYLFVLSEILLVADTFLFLRTVLQTLLSERVLVGVVVVGCVVLDRARSWGLHVVRLVDVGGGDAGVGLGLYVLVLFAQR
jgi:Na+-transporting NADH:ubiquinone oxidoreductase subunit NqrD